MITFSHKGDFKITTKFLKKASKFEIMNILRKYGEKGVQALQQATPKDTGKTAASWSYRVEKSNGSYSIVWSNSNTNNYVNIAVILQYGHATGTGGYVRGIDYINPAMKPIFDEIARDAWQEVIES